MAENIPGLSSTNLKEREIGFILGMNRAGLSYSQIAVECARSKSTIGSVIQRHGNESIIGATPALPKCDKRSLIHIVNKNRRAPLAEITKQLPEKISVRTLQR